VANETEAYLPDLNRILPITTKVMAFHDLNTNDLKREHAKDCRTLGGLLTAMQAVYPGFDMRETVTLVEFLVPVDAEHTSLPCQKKAPLKEANVQTLRDAEKELAKEKKEKKKEPKKSYVPIGEPYQWPPTLPPVMPWPKYPPPQKLPDPRPYPPSPWKNPYGPDVWCSTQKAQQPDLTAADVDAFVGALANDLLQSLGIPPRHL